MIVDGTDNADYFLYKYNLSNKDTKRIKIIDNFFKQKISSTKFLENELNKTLYYSGKQAVIDILNFKIIKSQKPDVKLKELKNEFINKSIPVMPIKADVIISKYKIPEGRNLGNKLKSIEEKWIDNDFNISDEEINYIINN